MTVTSVGENIWVFEQRTLTGSESFFFQYALTAALTVPNLYFQVSYLLLRWFTQKFVQERSQECKKSTSGWRASLKNVAAFSVS